MITITAEQIERVNLILSGVPGGIEKALSSTIRRANNTVRSETLKGITTVYAITRQNVRAETTIKVRTQSSDGGIVGTVLFAGHKIPLYRFNVSPTIPIQRATVSAAETGARRFKTRSLHECKADIQVCSSATVQSACLSASSWDRLRHRWRETVSFLPTWRKRHKRSSTSALNTKSPAF